LYQAYVRFVNLKILLVSDVGGALVEGKFIVDRRRLATSLHE
jgi:hypothetical protein